MAKPKLRAGQGGNNFFRQLTTTMKNVVKDNLNMLPTPEVAKGVSIALESYGPSGITQDDTNALVTSQENIEASLRPIIEGNADNAMKLDEGTGGIEGGNDEAAIATMREHQNDVALEAVSLMMLAHNNVGSWYTDYNSESNISSKVTRMNPEGGVGAAGSVTLLPMSSRPAMESFEEKETEKWRDQSYVINLLVAKQHEMLELFYRTYIATADEAGFAVSIRRNVIFKGYVHNESGDPIQLKEKQTNMLESLLEYRHLQTESTRAYPCWIEGKNEDKFIDDSEGFEKRNRTQEGEDFQTQFLKFGTTVTLIGICQTPSRLQKGSPDFTDSLDSRIAIDEIAVKIGGEPVVLDLNRTTKAQFVAVREGNFREMELDYRPTTIPLNEKTIGVNKKVPVALENLIKKGWEPKLEIVMKGNVNLQTGNTDIFCPRIRVSKLVSITNPDLEIKLDDPDVKDLVDALTVEAVGWYPEARLTNINQMERGLMIDSDVHKEGFQIPTLSPFVILKPSQTDDEKTYPRIEALQTAYRISMRNNGITTLLNRKEALRNNLGNDRPHPIESCLDMEGLGQYYVRPYYLEGEVDLLTDLNNLSSKDKMADINGLINGRINEFAYRADMYTGYSSALEVCFPGSTPKPHLAIGTDKRLPQYIMRQGDDRTVGPGMNYTVASISDLRMVNQIIMSFVLPNVKEIHPLHFGVLGMIPEWMVNFDMIRKERIAQEIRLTPRYRYFNFLPIMMVIIVKHLEEAIAMRTALDVNSKEVVEFPGEGDRGK